MISRQLLDPSPLQSLNTERNQQHTRYPGYLFALRLTRAPLCFPRPFSPHPVHQCINPVSPRNAGNSTPKVLSSFAAVLGPRSTPSPPCILMSLGECASVSSQGGCHFPQQSGASLRHQMSGNCRRTCRRSRIWACRRTNPPFQSQSKFISATSSSTPCTVEFFIIPIQVQFSAYNEGSWFDAEIS